jgi:serine/threonine protein kinase
MSCLSILILQLTDFGLSKVGLINSTDDLSGPAVSGSSLYGDDEPQMSEFEEMDHRARRQKRSAVGTPDYLAPEILLGTGHGKMPDIVFFQPLHCLLVLTLLSTDCPCRY